MDEDYDLPAASKPLSPLALTRSFSPVPASQGNAPQDDAPNQLHDGTNLQALSSNFQSLISPILDNIFSDVVFYVAGHVVPLHRCILAARCPFFMSLFTQDTGHLAFADQTNEHSTTRSSKIEIDIGKLFDGFPDVGKAGYEGFMTTVEFIYTGKQTIPSVACIDEDCSHEACRPVLGFAIDMLGLTSVLDIGILKSFWQNHLLRIVEKAGRDEVLLVLKAANIHETSSLRSKSIRLVALSDIDKFDIEKQLPVMLAAEVLALRRSMGLLEVENLNPTYDKNCERIRKALDSDDVELVRLLLKEGDVSLDQAHGLHYAVSYCNPHTVKDLVECGLVDVNLKNDRGLTPLHVAAMRCDPSILITLLSEGADSLATTSDGRTAFDIISRIARKGNKLTEQRSNLQSDWLCFKILRQAKTTGLFEDAAEIFPPTNDAKKLFMRLIYLENRMAVAQLLFPVEAKLVADICHLKYTTEFVGFGLPESSDKHTSEGKVDLEQVSSSHLSISKASLAAASMPIPMMNDSHLKRSTALQKCIIVGRKMFPGTVAVLNIYNDEDDMSELANIEVGDSREQKQKKRRHRELKQILEDAAKQDSVTINKRTTRPKHSHPHPIDSPDFPRDVQLK